MRRFCLAIVALFTLAAPAAAGGCCGYGAPAYDLQPVVPVSTYRFDAPAPVGQVYVVNQGPWLTGPGIYAYTNHYVPSFVPTAFPYVSGCGGYGGCGQSYSYGCGGCGQSYDYGYGCGYGGCGGRGLWSGGAVGYQWNGGYTGSRWNGGYTGHRWNGGYTGYRGYRPYRTVRHHVAPAAGAVPSSVPGTVAPSRGY